MIAPSGPKASPPLPHGQLKDDDVSVVPLPSGAIAGFAMILAIGGIRIARRGR